MIDLFPLLNVKEISGLVRIDGCCQTIVLIQFVDMYEYVLLLLNTGLRAAVDRGF